MDTQIMQFSLALIASVGIYGIYWAFQIIYKKNLKIFTDRELTLYPWRQVATIKSLWIYPVKSCRGISVTQFTAKKEGAMVGQFRDRSFIIVDRKYNYVSAKNYPSLLKIIPTLNIEEGSMTLTYLDTEPLNLNLQLIKVFGEPCVVQLFNTSVPGLDCGEEAASWLAATVHYGHRLVYHRHVSSKRTIVNNPKFPYVCDTDGTLYADEFPYLLTSTASINDVNDRIGVNIPIENFRPNIHIDNDVPYEEDDFTYLEMAGMQFRNVQLCIRCVFTTLHYETGDKCLSCEPLNTLRKYRSLKNGQPPFGIHLAIYNSEVKEETVSVGDVIRVSTAPRVSQ